MDTYEKKYKEALELARVAAFNGHQILMEGIFPELKGSEDEKTRKALISFLKSPFINDNICDWKVAPWIAWLENIPYTIDHEKREGFHLGYKAALEKQGEQKPTDKVEPKFKVGDWCIDNEDGVIFQIVRVFNDTYNYKTNEGKKYCCSHYSLENDARLWTIQDAKNGDVLDANGAPFIYKKHSKDYVYFYCGVNLAGNFIEANGIDTWDSNNKVYPATKEQRDLLFKKMKEACYEWDAENKQLKKIDNEIEIPFGAKDSELQEATYYIPKGFHAEIEGNNVVIKKGEQKPAWSEEDECYMGECIGAIATKDGWSFEEKRKTKHWLKSMKERCSWNPSDEQITVLELASKYERVFTPKQIDILIGLKEQLKKLRGE